MNRRRFLLLSFSSCTVSLAPGLGGCVSEHEVIRYARVLGVACASIGTLLEKDHPQLGTMIRETAEAIIVAADKWVYDEGTAGLLVNAIQTLQILLETIPTGWAGLVAALLPIALAAIQALLGLVPQTLAPSGFKAPAVRDPIVWHPGHIKHHFGYPPSEDFEREWDSAAHEVPGAAILK